MGKFCWNWDQIDKIGRSKSFKSSYWFLLFVPTLAKLFHAVAPDGQIIILGRAAPIHLALPFSWVALFFCSLFVSFGNALYSLRCPLLIKAFSDYPTFQVAARGTQYLRESLCSLSKGGVKQPDEIANVVDAIAATLDRPPDSVTIVNVKHQLKQHDPPGSDSFYFVRDAANEAYPAWRCAASTSYIIGFIILGWLFLQNVSYVVSYLFGRAVS